MGHGSRGAGGSTLSADKISMFFKAVAALVKVIIDVLNKELVPLLGELNGIPEENYPAFFTDKPEQVDLGALGAYINALAASGMTMFPNKDLEDYLMEVAGLPEPTEETRAQQAELQNQQMEQGQPGTGGEAPPPQGGSTPMGQGAPKAGGGKSLFGGTAQPTGGPPKPGAGADPRMGAQGSFGQSSGKGVV
jgi:hypothetical protein